MRSLRKLFAFSAVSTACAFLSWPAHANTSWDHNGSLMVLEENGTKRKLVYAEPRGTLDTAGVKKGTVLFDGEEKADGRLAGYAKLFRVGCDPVDYFVEGSLDKTKGEILLQGQAPIYSGQGCKITGYSDDNTASSLTFRQQGGGAYVSGIDQAQPDADGRYSSRYASPQDQPLNRDDPAYADPQAGDPRNNERDFADPRDRYPRYGGRDLADRQPGYPRYPRNDGYSARPPVNPDDPDADAYSDDYEEEEPAYVPYRPFWRWGN